MVNVRLHSAGNANDRIDATPVKMCPARIALLVSASLLADAQLAADLRSGMQLVYSSNGGDQAPWSIDAVETGLKLKGDADCASVSIRRQPDQLKGDESRLCLDGKMSVRLGFHEERLGRAAAGGVWDGAHDQPAKRRYGSV